GPAFNLTRAVDLPAERMNEYVGWYAGEVEDAVVVTPGSEGGLRFFHLGRLSGTLRPLARDEFAMASLDQASTVLRVRARFTRDASGRVAGLDIGDDPVAHRTRLARIATPPFRQQHVDFRNGDVRLGGTLFSPADDLAHPAIVFIHGTGYQTADRGYEMSLTTTFLQRGIAVLLFDKRGCGSSSGSWRTASLSDLAEDVAAAVAALGSNPAVDADRIGVYGVSEGGWVAPMVAHSAAIAFVINQGGPAVTPLEDELDDLTTGIARLGLAREDSISAMNLARAWVELYRSAEAMPRYRAALDAARARPWFAPFESRFPTSEDDWEVQWWRKRGRLDPLPLWEAVPVPALVLIGEKDATMDVAKNVALFERVEQSGRVELRVIPDADHGLFVSGGLAANFPDAVADWILATLE
ncbi:MAG TPA: alpha/beta fold hydrolase, partial [Candidatus Krumholzibacteria bacterium]|nr:alpha/beta fold hydrolase [Candidatus Krumholzibacteria bacterium]